MEYKPTFGKFDWDTVRRGKFQGRNGKFMSLARLIYNGLSYNFGSQDGAVTIGDGFTVWRFIAPVDRFVVSDYVDLPLQETLSGVIAETERVPVPAWNEFFSFLGGNEDIANAALLGHDVIRVGGVKVNFQPIQNCTDFSSFMRWLTANLGEAGNLQSSDFIAGQDMIIPLDMYNSVPVAMTLKNPTQIPEYKEDVVIGTSANWFIWSKTDTAPFPFFTVSSDVGIVVYSPGAATDPDSGVSLIQGWNKLDLQNGQYIPYDMEANPITVPITDWTSLTDAQKQLLKCFGDFIYDETQEVYDGTINFMFRA